MQIGHFESGVFSTVKPTTKVVGISHSQLGSPFASDDDAKSVVIPSKLNGN